MSDPIAALAQDQTGLLDTIDQLRLQGVDQYIPLPQIIVCGDQSSGKSSTLAAISGFDFPVGAGCCTRAVTEVILRRSKTQFISVSITPGPQSSKHRSKQDNEQLGNFKVTGSLRDLAVMTDKATRAMGLPDEKEPFRDDVLRVEVSGPDQPHLTLVDLPGLFHVGEGSEFVKTMVRRYMQSERSIILAVVSARNDFENQVVTKLIKEEDPDGKRTMGVITKPDDIEGSSDESTIDRWLELAKNQRVHYELGWHVLRNRKDTEKNCSIQERNTKEKDFFLQGKWANLSRDNAGIAALTPRLTTILHDHILIELPRLIDNVNTGISDCKRILDNLGPARATVDEQRRYLGVISKRCSSLLLAAVKGDYEDSAFPKVSINEDDSSEDESDVSDMRLRAVIQNRLVDFEAYMRRWGHKYDIVADNTELVETKGHQIQISESDFLNKVSHILRQSRGRELPGCFNPMIVAELFKMQCEPWASAVNDLKDDLLTSTRRCVGQVVSLAAGNTTSRSLTSEIVSKREAEIRASFDDAMTNMMTRWVDRHPITYNHYFIDNIQKTRHEDNKNDIRSRLLAFFNCPSDQSGTQNLFMHRHFTADQLVRELVPDRDTDTEANMDKYSCKEAVRCMKAYYKVALKVVIDDVADAFESHIMQQLPDVFSSDVVLSLEAKVVERIAKERPDKQAQRAAIEAKLASLKLGKETFEQIQ
jgi:hypothetical protein